MSQFRATIKGSRGMASRLGDKRSGIRASIDGWNIGVDVTLRYDAERDCDCVHVRLTCGSNGGTIETLIDTDELALQTENRLNGTR